MKTKRNSAEGLVVVTTIRIPKGQHDRLRELAAAEHRSISGELRKLVAERIAAAADNPSAA